MSELLDNSFELLPLPAKRRIDAICARFEQAWREGQPQIEAYLGEAPADEQSVLLGELLLLEIEYRRRKGEDPCLDDYLHRLPDREALLRTILPEASKADTPHNTGQEQLLPSPALPGRRPLQVPGYEMLEELGRGGMGVVYKARHVALNRLVALKFILSGSNAPSRHQERFHREAEFVARLRHPNIVQIYDIGEVDGQCFLALEYAEGGSLRERQAGTPMEPRAAAALLEPVARAVQHAHRQGVVHRDIKPANVLLAVGGDSVALGNRPLPDYRSMALDLPRVPELQAPLAACTPKLTDFGLARMLDDDIPRAERGMAAGTPQYMAPEQALGQVDAGPLIDVWAIGATLYEMLTGRPPFRAASARETLRMVLEDDPVAPRLLNPSVPRDLETICLKCLEKEPARRYPGARELAQDLRRFLDGEAILARRINRLGRLRKWANRHPFRALGLFFLVMALLVGIGFLTGTMIHALIGWAEATRKEKDAVSARGTAESQARQARRGQQQAEEARRDADRQAASLLLEVAQTQGRNGEPARAVHDLLTALRLVQDESGDLARILRTNLAAWLPHVHRLEYFLSLKEESLQIAPLPDGRLIVADATGVSLVDRGGSLKRLHRARQTPRLLSLASDGPQLLISEGNLVLLIDLATEGPPTEILCPVRINDGLIMPDKSVFLAGEDGIVRRYDRMGSLIEPNLTHPLAVRRLAASPDGRSLAVAGGDTGAVTLWDLEAEPVRSRPLASAEKVTALAFHPGGDLLFTGDNDGRVRLWDVTTGRARAPTISLPDKVVHLEPTPDGRLLLIVTTDEVARLWDVQAGQIVGVFRGATATARLGGVGSQLVMPMSGEVRIHRLATPLSRLGQVAMKESGRVREGTTTPSALVPPSRLVAFFADRERMLIGESIAGRVSVVNSTPEQDPRPFWIQPFAEVSRVALSANGQRAATISRQGEQSAVCLWDVPAGKQLGRPVLLPVRVEAIAFSCDGKELAAGDARGAIRRWDSTSANLLEPIWVGAAVQALAYHPDGRRIGVGTAHQISFYDRSSREKSGEAIPVSSTRSFSFDPSGDHLLVDGRTTSLWQLTPRRAHVFSMRNVTLSRFAQGDQVVLVGTSDGHVHRIKSAEGTPVGPPVTHPRAVRCVDLSANGRLLLVASEGQVCLWDVSGPPRPLGPGVVAGGSLLEARFRGDKRSFLTLNEQGEVRTWPLDQPLQGSMEQIERLVLLTTGSRIDAGGLLVPLTRPEWEMRKVRVEETHEVSAVRASWHQARALDAWQENDLFASRWHLDRLVVIAPKNHPVLRQRAVVLARLGQYTLALADYHTLSSSREDGLGRELEAGLARCQRAGDGNTARWYEEQIAARRK
jgi:serine/threonine protein kinase/WD40 repeat protein